MKLAYSTNAYSRWDLNEALTSIARLGFTHAEILCDRPHWFPGTVDTAELRRTAALLARLGLGIGNVNLNTANGYHEPPPMENTFEPSLSNGDEALRAWRVAHVIEGVRLAHEIGATCISITSGRPQPGVPPAEALDYFAVSVGRICRVASEYGIKVGIEYEPGLLVERAAEALEVIRRVASPVLGVNLDIGHSYLAGEDARIVIGQLAGRIWNVHVEDIGNGKHYHLIPGTGELPIGRYLAALREAAYDGCLTVELYSYPQCPEAAGARALAYLRGILRAGQD